MRWYCAIAMASIRKQRHANGNHTLVLRHCIGQYTKTVACIPFLIFMQPYHIADARRPIYELNWYERIAETEKQPQTKSCTGTAPLQWTVYGNSGMQTEIIHWYCAIALASIRKQWHVFHFLFLRSHIASRSSSYLQGRRVEMRCHFIIRIDECGAVGTDSQSAP